MVNKEFIKLISHSLCFSFSLVLMLVFFLAYIAQYIGYKPYYALVAINNYGEAHLEALMFFILTPLILLGLYYTYTDFMHYKENKKKLNKI